MVSEILTAQIDKAQRRMPVSPNRFENPVSTTVVALGPLAQRHEGGRAGCGGSLSIYAAYVFEATADKQLCCQTVTKTANSFLSQSLHGTFDYLVRCVCSSNAFRVLAISLASSFSPGKASLYWLDRTLLCRFPSA